MNIKMDVKVKMKLGGHRESKTRETIIEILQSETRPVSVPEILQALEKNGVNVNKTTVYREIEKLMNHTLVQPVYFDDEVVRYELSLKEHHHHLVCVSCRDVQDVKLKKDLSTEEKRIASTNNFRIMRHSLEFFGICNKCQY